MSAPGVAPEQRYTRNRRCPVCDGCEQDPRGQETRCVGFVSADGFYARCSRKGTGKQDDLGCYVHRLSGPCNCGEQHGEQRRESSGKGPIVASYDYTDENGNLLYRVDRRVTPAGKKTFSQRRPDGLSEWISDTEGVRQVPWKLPDLIAADSAQPVFVVEGEKCATALHKLGLVATTARGGTGGVKQWDSYEFCAPFKDRNVAVLPDVDADGKGRRYAERVAKALSGIACSVKIVDLPGLEPKSEDVVEWIERGGTAKKLMELVAAAPTSDREPGEDDGEREQEPGENDAAAGRTRPVIIVSPNETAVIDQAVAALANAREIFQRGGDLVEVIEEEVKTRGMTRPPGPIARIKRCAAARVQELMAREAAWLGPSGGDGDFKSVHPSEWAVKGLLARGQWRGVRTLVALSTAPTLRPDGSVLSNPGFDSSTGIFLTPDIDVSVPDRPTQAQAAAAAEMLISLLVDFPATKEGKSAWVAAVLTVVARHAIDGNVPLFIFDASASRSGKTLLATLVCRIAFGKDLPAMTYNQKEDEFRKNLTAGLLAGDPLVLFDNVKGNFGCQTLDAVLTAPGCMWRDRILGVSKRPDIPALAVFLATCNNARISGDLAGRSMMTRLVPLVEHPGERSGFKIPDIKQYVLDHRAELLGAALTMVRSFILAHPTMELPAMGGFEAWTNIVRGAIVWSGLKDPYGTVLEIREADSTADSARALIEAWPAYEQVPLSVAELLDKCNVNAVWKEAVVGLCPPPFGERLPAKKDLGYALRDIRGKVIGDFMVNTVPGPHNTNRWCRMRVEKKPEHAG